MIEPPVTTDLREPVAATPHPNGRDAYVAALEQRVHRLEDAIASLQDTRPLEERVFERVADRIDQTSQSVRSSVDVMPEAGPRVLPTLPVSINVEPPAPVAIPVIAQPRFSLRDTTILYDAYVEFRCILRMYFDPRYRMSWMARIVPLALLAVFVVSYYMLPGSSFPAVGWIWNKVFDVVILFVAFKIISREVRTYRQMSPDLPPSWRL
jgi:hypothetical protein